MKRWSRLLCCWHLRGSAGEDYPTRRSNAGRLYGPAARKTRLARIWPMRCSLRSAEAWSFATVSGASGTIASGRVVHASRTAIRSESAIGRRHCRSPRLPLDYDIFKEFAAGRAAGRLAVWIVGQERSSANDRARTDHLVEGEGRDPGDFRHHRLRRAALCAAMFLRKERGAAAIVRNRGGATAMKIGSAATIDRSCLKPRRDVAMLEEGAMQGLCGDGRDRWPKSQ